MSEHLSKENICKYNQNVFFTSLEKIAKEIITIKLVKIYLIAEIINPLKDIQKSAKTLILMVNVDIKNGVHTSM